MRYQLPPHGVFRNVAEPTRAPTYPAIRVRVVRPFYGLRRLLEAGEVVALAEPDAVNAIALRRAVKV